MTLDFVLNVFTVKKRPRQSLADFELALHYGMHFFSVKLFCGRIDPFSDRICVAPIVFACDTQKSSDLLMQFLMVLWKIYGTKFREWLLGKMKEMFAKNDLQPNGQLLVLTVICKSAIGKHEGLQDELKETFIETTTKRRNDWLQAHELALRDVEAPELLTQFVVNSGAFLLSGRYESHPNVFNKVLARMSLEEAKEFIMEQFGEEGPSTAIEWHLVAKLFRMFADHREELLDILPRKNRSPLTPDGANEYIDIIYGQIMASAGSSFLVLQVRSIHGIFYSLLHLLHVIWMNQTNQNLGLARSQAAFT
jgi:hypothetical protein